MKDRWCRFPFKYAMLCRYLLYYMIEIGNVQQQKVCEQKHYTKTNKQSQSCFNRTWMSTILWSTWSSEQVLYKQEGVRLFPVSNQEGSWLCFVDFCCETGNVQSLVLFKIRPQHKLYNQTIPTLQMFTWTVVNITSNCCVVMFVGHPIGTPLIHHRDDKSAGLFVFNFL